MEIASRCRGCEQGNVVTEADFLGALQAGLGWEVP